MQKGNSDITNCKILGSRSHFISLSPLLDENGLLRVGGKLYNSNLAYETKHPILLPKDHVLRPLSFATST